LKNNFNRDCLRAAILLLLFIIAVMLFYTVIKSPTAVFENLLAFSEVFKSITIAFIIAYILNPVVNFFKDKILSPIKNEKASMAVSVALTYLIVIVLIGIFIWLLLPALVKNIHVFVLNFNLYLERFNSLADSLSRNIYFGGKFFVSIKDILASAATAVTGWISGNFLNLVNFVFKTTDIFIELIVSIFISIYMLYSRVELTSQIKKAMLALLPRSLCDGIMRITAIIHESFSSYMSGVFVSAFITGGLCWICMWIFGLEYAPLISLIVLITDIIPYFGPFIGAGLGTLLIFLAKPTDALYFLVLIIILQQITSNVINPGIIGKATGLDSIYVIISIIIMGGFFGITGMLIGVPVFVILLKATRKFISYRTKEKNCENTTA